MEGIHMTIKDNPARDLDYTVIMKKATKKDWRFTDKKFQKMLAKGQSDGY